MFVPYINFFIKLPFEHFQSDQLPAICQLPSGSSASVPYTAQSSGSAGRERIPLSMTIQLFRADRVRTLAELKNVQILHKMKENDEGGEGREARRKRNEVFIWLRSADLHGVGRSEKNVEVAELKFKSPNPKDFQASISVVDDEGVFQPEAIEVSGGRPTRYVIKRQNHADCDAGRTALAEQFPLSSLVL